MRAVVLFADVEGASWLARRLLKPGFRHCAVIIEADGFWVFIDAERRVPRLRVMGEASRDIAAECRAQGFTVLETEGCDTGRNLPFVAATCVGLVKAVLGLGGLQVTPYQLHQKLLRELHR